MGYRDLAAVSTDTAVATLERWASAGRSRRAVEGELAVARIATGADVDPTESGMSWPEAFVGGLWVVSVAVLVLGIRATSGLVIGLAVPLWLLSVVLSIPVFGGLALFRGVERAYIAGLPIVIDGYLDTLERARLVRTLRFRLHFDPASPIDLEWMRDVFLGAGFTGDLRPDGPASAWVYCHVPRSRALPIRRWFRKMLDEVLLPLHRTRGLRRVDVEEV